MRVIRGFIAAVAVAALGAAAGCGSSKPSAGDAGGSSGASGVASTMAGQHTTAAGAGGATAGSSAPGPMTQAALQAKLLTDQDLDFGNALYGTMSGTLTNNQVMQQEATGCSAWDEFKAGLGAGGSPRVQNGNFIGSYRISEVQTLAVVNPATESSTLDALGATLSACHTLRLISITGAPQTETIGPLSLPAAGDQLVSFQLTSPSDPTYHTYGSWDVAVVRSGSVVTVIQIEGSVSQGDTAGTLPRDLSMLRQVVGLALAKLAS
jgi:hypothetical protein